MNKIDFGYIGVKIGDVLEYKNNTDITCIVASGKGIPGNGGTLVKYQGIDGACSLRYMTGRIL